jgi:inorganic pyrophosphatase
MPRSARENAVEAALEVGVQRLDAGRMNAHAWRLWERLIDERGIVIDRRGGEGHPLLPDMIYPYDYGHIPGTAAADGHEVDAFVGCAQLGLVGLIALVHEPSGIADPKLLVNLTPDDADVIMAFLDRGDPGPDLILVWRRFGVP